MRKTLFTAILLNVAVLLFTGCDALVSDIKKNSTPDITNSQSVTSDNKSNNNDNSSNKNKNNINDMSTVKITKEQAENIALSHAGLTTDKVTRLHSEYDYDDDRQIYEYDVDFICEGYEYDYEINAETGEVIFSQKEIDD